MHQIVVLEHCVTAIVAHLVGSKFIVTTKFFGASHPKSQKSKMVVFPHSSNLMNSYFPSMIFMVSIRGKLIVFDCLGLGQNL